VASTKDDALLTILVAAAKQQIETYCHRTFEASATASTKHFDAIRDIDNEGYLLISEDLASISAITNGDGVVIAETDYVTAPSNHAPYYAIKLKQGASTRWTHTDSPENAIAINGKWGYATTCPADIKQAIVRLTAYMYAQKDASSFDTTMFPGEGVMTVPSGIPKDVLQIIDGYKRLR